MVQITSGLNGGCVPHGTTAYPRGTAPYFRPFTFGHASSPSFFVVSGYVISEACEQFCSNRPGAFLGNRFFRIYPPFIFALGVSLSVHFVCYLFGRHGEVFLSANDVLAHLNFREVARNVFSLLDNTIPNGKENYYLFVRYVWAIVVEVQFYLVMAVIFYLRKTLPVRLHISFRLVLTLLCLLYLFHITFKMSGIKGIDYTPYFFAWCNYISTIKKPSLTHRRLGRRICYFYTS